MPIRGCYMTDDRLDQLSGVEDAEATLRDDMQGESGPIELSASDIEALEPAEETTQVIERSRLEEASSADVTNEELRTTLQNQAVDAMTTERHVPEELLNRALPTRERRQRLRRDSAGEVVEHDNETRQFEAIPGPKTEKMQAIGTRPLPRVDDPEETAVRGTDSGEWAELDEEGFLTFIARTDAQGRVTLPKALFADEEPAEGVMVFVRVKNLKSE